MNPFELILGIFMLVFFLGCSFIMGKMTFETIKDREWVDTFLLGMTTLAALGSAGGMLYLLLR